MELSMRELNELIYCISVARKHGQLLGTSVADNLEVALRDELDRRLEGDYLTTIKQDEQRYENSHYVSNEEADEDAFTSAQNNEYDRYESSVEKDYSNYISKLNERGFVTQTLLDYVDKKGAVSHGELETYYKQITGGSNSFSHILESLRTPYKNRKTQRYLAKEGRKGSNAKWVVKVANPSNWVVVND